MILSKLWGLLHRRPEVVSYADFSDRVADMLEYGGWIRLTAAKDSKGRLVEYRSSKATQFCASGAVLALMRRYRRGRTVFLAAEEWGRYFHEYLTFTDYYEHHCTQYDKPYLSWDQKVGGWNDGIYQTKENVISAFRGFCRRAAESRDPEIYNELTFGIINVLCTISK